MADSGDSWVRRLGRRLQELRRKAGLSRSEVADRMGMAGRTSVAAVGRLERGALPSPSIRSVRRFLRACGARWYQVAAVLDAEESEPLDLRPVDAAALAEADNRKVKERITREVERYELRQPSTFHAKPEHPAKQKQSAERFRRYRVVANLVEQGVLELLRDCDITVLLYPWYRAAARQLLGRLWRMARTEAGRKEIGPTQSPLPDRLTQFVAQREAEWEQRGLDPELTAQVLAVTKVRFQVLLESHPELFTGTASEGN